MTTATVDDIMDNESALRLRIVTLDYYMSEPNVSFDDIYSVFRQNEIKRVAVLRVFGITDNGMKTCLHIHKVYPYLSIRYEAKVGDDYEFEKQKFMTQLVQQLESRLMPDKVRTRNNTKDSPNVQLVYDIKEVDAIPFYGFHDNYKKFLRIYFYNPSTVQKVSELLLSGQIMDRQIQPFEAHIPYTLQFLIDNNLYGMNFLSAKRVDYRKTDALDSDILFSDIEPMSSCQLECDIDFDDILNRRTNVENSRLPGLEAIWAEQLKRCNNSQEMMNLKGVSSQERSDIPISTNLEAYHMKRLFDGLSRLNIRVEDNLNVNSTQLNRCSVGDESDFAQIMIDCIGDKDEESSCDQISQTIEEVVDNSQHLAISQTIDDVITESQRRNKCTIKPKKNTRRKQSQRRLNFNDSTEESDRESVKSVDTDDHNTQNNNECEPTVRYVETGTQTEVDDNFDESIDSVFGLVDELEEIVCDCDSDECCDQCCDRGSDQCECDCERCEFEKCKRIPQMDGAYDNDDSGSNFSAPNIDDSGDSDFEASSKKSKRGSKKGAKRSKSTRTVPRKRKKSVVSVPSDSDVDSYSAKRSSPKSRPAPSRKSPSFSPPPNDDVFESSSGRKVKSSKNLSESLWDKFKSNPKKRRTSSSPIHASFSESDGSDRETTSKKDPLGFLKGINHNFSYPTKKTSTNKNDDDNRSERSVTPYLSHESEDEAPPKTKPGPRFSKASDVPKSSKPGPQSSKSTPRAGPMSSKSTPRAGPMSSKSTPRAGPKSSKSTPKAGPKSIAKAEPKSSKRDSIEISSNSENDGYPTITTSRSRRTNKSVNYDTNIESISTIYSEKSTPKQRKTGKAKQPVKSEMDSAIDSISECILSVEDVSDECLHITELSELTHLSWKSIRDDLFQFDEDFYGSSALNSVGNEKLHFKSIPDFIVKPYIRRYEQNADYWEQAVIDVEDEIKNGRKSGTRSKGALKDFYTLPHLNDRNSPEKSKPKSLPEATARATLSAKKSGSRKSNGLARLITEAAHILDKPLTKRGAAQKIATKKKAPASSSRAQPKRENKRETNSASKRSARKARSRISRRVTSSTLFDSINIPFYGSDIKVVTELTGYKKKAYLKSLCESFELDVNRLDKRENNRYIKHQLSANLFDDIYYNDYSGILPEELCRDAQDVLITVKNLIIDVVAVSQCVSSAINEVCSEFEPKPMIDNQEEDYFDDTENVDETDEWGYGDEQQAIIGIAVDSGVVVTTFDDLYTNSKQTEIQTINAEIGINGTNDPLSDVLLKTFVNSEDEEVNGQQIEATIENEEHIQEDNGDDEDENRPNEDCSQEGAEDVDDLPVQQFSPEPPAHDYSNQSNGYHLERDSPQYDQQSQYEEDEDEDDGSTDNSNHSSSNQIIGHTVDAQFKLQSDYNQMYSYNVSNSHNQNMVFQPNPLQNPIVPTVMPANVSPYPSQPAYPVQQQWSPIPDMTPQSPALVPQYSSMPTLNAQPPAQTDNEFEVSNYNYMPYYTNQNIPQFDGIFDDDDDYQTVGKSFNMKCSSDETIEQLSQGSRSEQASPKKHAADMVVEALRAGNSGIQKRSSAINERAMSSTVWPRMHNSGTIGGLH